MRKVYVKPEMEMSFFENLDVIVTSGEDPASYSIRSLGEEDDTQQIDNLPEIVQPTTEADPVATTEASTEEVETTTATTAEEEVTAAIAQDDDTFGTDNE